MHTIESIKKGISDYYQIDLASKKRDAKHFRARSVFYKLCFNLCYKPTFQAIGSAVNRDHSTVCYAMKTWDDNLKFDSEMRDMYDTLKEIYSDVSEVTIPELMRSNTAQKEMIVELQKEVSMLKKLPDVVSKYEEIKLLNQLLDKMGDDDRYLLSCKLEALYNLNKNKIK